jgi:hypothetical protein
VPVDRRGLRPLPGADFINSRENFFERRREVVAQLG